MGRFRRCVQTLQPRRQRSDLFCWLRRCGRTIIFWEVGQFLVRLLPPDLSVEGVENAQGWQVPTQQLYDSYDPTTGEG